MGLLDALFAGGNQNGLLAQMPPGLRPGSLDPAMFAAQAQALQPQQPAGGLLGDLRTALGQIADPTGERQQRAIQNYMQLKQLGLQEKAAEEKPQVIKLPDPQTGIERGVLVQPFGKGASYINPTDASAKPPAGGATIPPPPPGADPAEWRKLQTKGLYEAQDTLPNVEAQSAQALKTIQDIRSDPYKSWGTGMTSPLARIPGTPVYDFAQKVEQLKGRTFLDAYQTLKGSGAITEAEGAKATAAIGRLNTGQTGAGFDASLKDLEDVVQSGLTRARQKAQSTNAGAPSATAAPQSVAQPKSKADFDALPAGATFLAPDGTMRKKQ